HGRLRRLEGRRPSPDREPGRGAQGLRPHGQRRAALDHRHAAEPGRHARRRSGPLGRSGGSGRGDAVPRLPGRARRHRGPGARHRPGLMLRPRRSVLFLPASNPRAIDKARTLACDVVVLDLEDAVGPEAKTSAREAAVAAVAEGFGDRETAIRVNALDTPWGAIDLAAAAAAGPDV